jgi:hypothetical protein
MSTGDMTPLEEGHGQARIPGYPRPAFVIGSEVLPGAFDEKEFRQLIAKTRAEANSRVSKQGEFSAP